MPKTDVLNSNSLNNILICIVLLKALSFGRAFSQSHISNGHFNTITECPKFWSQKATEFKIEQWWSPTAGTPDTYNICSKMCGTQNNWLGGTTGQQNEGFIGLVIQSFNKNAETHYREYVQTELRLPLIKDSIYVLSFDIYYPSKCQYITTDLGFLFSEQAIKSSTEGILPIQQNFPQVVKIPLLEKGKWISVSQEYLANGRERFLTLGNFLYAMSDPLISSGEFPLSYVFIDNVNLKSSKKTIEHLASNEQPLSKGLTYTIGKVFDLEDDATLHTSSKTDTAHAYCSCFNCMLLRGEIDKSLTKLEFIPNFEVKEGQRIDLNDIIFDVTTGAIRPESRLFLNKLIFFLTEIEHADLRFIVYTYESNPNGEAIARETSLNLYHLLRKSGISNTISFLHDTKNTLSRIDGIPADRSIELHIVKLKN